MVAQDFGPVVPNGRTPSRRRVIQVATVCAAAACLAAVIVTGAGAQRRAVLMTDDSLEATTIGIDHNAMLAGNTQQNAAFLQTFGNYLPNQGPTLATGTTQLAQAPPAKSEKQSATSRLNAKLAAQMQAQLTASTQGDSLMTPHFVAALEQATGSSRSQMLSQQQQAQQKATMDALSMTESKTHILPANMRQKFAITSTKNTLGSMNNLTPQEAAMRVSPMGDSAQSLSQASPSATGGNPASASRADSAFLSAEPPQQLTAKQLIQQAALKQMNSLPAPAPAPAVVQKPAPVQQLAQYPVQPMGQPQQAAPMQYRAVPQYAPMQMAYQPQPQYAPTQMAYQMPNNQPYNGYYQPAAQPSMYPNQQAATQEMYQMASPVKPAPYQAPQQPQQPMMAQKPQQPYVYDPAQAAVNTASPAAMMAYSPQPQQLMQQPQPQPQPQQQQYMQQQQPILAAEPSSIGDASNVGLQTPAEIGAAAASKVTAPPSWKNPDMSLQGAKGAKGKISAAAKNKIKAQMQALRSSILADYKKNSRMANTALLLGPGGL